MTFKAFYDKWYRGVLFHDLRVWYWYLVSACRCEKWPRFWW